MKIWITLISLITAFSNPVEFSDLVDDVSAAVKTGNAASVSAYFATSVDLKILDKEDVFSKAQAELILKDFFSKNPVKAFSILHKGTSKSGDQFAIGSYENAGGKKFRTYFLFKKEGAALKIQQLRFESQDE